MNNFSQCGSSELFLKTQQALRNAFDLFAEIQAEAEERIVFFRSKVLVGSL